MGRGGFVGGPMVLLLKVVVAHTRCVVARGGLGEHWAAGLIRLPGEVQVGRGGMGCPAPSHSFSTRKKGDGGANTRGCQTGQTQPRNIESL